MAEIFYEGCVVTMARIPDAPSLAVKPCPELQIQSVRQQWRRAHHLLERHPGCVDGRNDTSQGTMKPDTKHRLSLGFRVQNLSLNVGS